MHFRAPRSFLWGAGLIACWLGLLPGHAQIQFDVFLGYDGLAREANWMPVVCEVKNDGPGFNGVVELSTANQADGTVARLAVELPTGTLKRLVMPVFVHSSSYAGWDARLRDDRGKVRAEQLAVQPRRSLSWRVPLVGAVPRTAAGAPVLREVLSRGAEIQPVAARFQAAIFPDHPLALSGMSMLYLNSEKAAELRSSQAAALVHWVKGGGHLVVAAEQAADVAAAPWLKALLPCQLGEVITNGRAWQLEHWLRTAPLSPYDFRPGEVPANPYENLTGDPAFEAAAMLVTGCRVREGRVVVADGETPLMVSVARGRGQVTVLLFSPEREPARSWKNLPSFWARLAGVPPVWYVSADIQNPPGWSGDSIVAAMIETAQVQTLPVQWLLLLLFCYLLVIGPLDQYWLKRLGRPMLTWITFPCYVLFFSLLIYGIGYKLRAGDSEWNELHMVDVLSQETRADLRGRSYLSAYSPANETYTLKSPHGVATLRAEFASYASAPSGDRVRVEQAGDAFEAQVFVPVWASRMYVNDWLAPGELPVKVTVIATGEGWRVTAENLTLRTLKHLHLAVAGRVARLSDLPPRQVHTWRVLRGETALGDALPTESISDLVMRHSGSFQQAIQFRRRTFGSSVGGRIADVPGGAVAYSFLSAAAGQPNAFGVYILPTGVDLCANATAESAVLLAWDENYSPAPRLYRFTPKRAHQDTLWRVVAPVQ